MHDVKEPAMLGHADMPSGAGGVAQLLVLHIVLQTPAPFASDAQLSASRALSDLARKFTHLPPDRQVRFATILGSAIQLAPVRHVLSRAAASVAEWPELDDDVWQTAVEQLLRKVETLGDASLHRDVWWAILPSLTGREGSSIKLDTKVGRAKIMLLLEPASPHLTIALIRKLLPKSCLEQWALDVTSAHAELRERLVRYTQLPPPTSRKRKRQTNPVEERALCFLRSKIPELKIESLDSLRRSLADLDASVTLKLLGSNPMIACALCHCSDAHGILPSDFVLKLVKDGCGSVQDDYTLMRALGILFPHANPTDVISPVWEKALARAWSAFSSSDRRTRLAAG